MENECYYVGSMGIRKACEALNNPKIVYKHVDHIRHYILFEFPYITENIVLVTGCGDHPLPYSQFTEYEFQWVINNPKLIHWFSQNL